MPRSAPWFTLVICLVGLLLARESRQPGPVSGIDRAFFDWLTANTRAAAPAPSLPTVTLVEIDQSVADAPGRLPLSALEYALFLQAVEKYDPAVVAIEPVLDWSVAGSGVAQAQAGGEQILLNQALNVPKLLLGFRLGSAERSAGADSDAIPALNDVRGSRLGLEEYPDVAAAPGSRLLPMAASGATNLDHDRDRAGAVVRGLPLVFACRERVLPSFALQTLTLGLQLAPSEVGVEIGSGIQLGNRLRLPIDRAGCALLDARLFTRFRRINLDDLMLLNAGQDLPENAPARAVAEHMRGGIVILGRTDAAVRGPRVPGVEAAVSPAEVLAWAAESLEQSPPTRRASGWWDAGIVAGSAAAGWFLLRRGPAAGVALVLGGLAVYSLAALSAFEMTRLWLPLSLPLGLALTSISLLWFLPAAPAVAPKPPSTPPPRSEKGLAPLRVRACLYPRARTKAPGLLEGA